MASTASVLLNTENYEPLFEIVRQITNKIKENERLLARIANIVDNKIVYPEGDSLEETKADEGEVAASGNNDGDYLRSILDAKFASNNMGEVHQFDDVENPIVRQLLCDNYQLLAMKKAKQEKNHQLLQINSEYEVLLAEQLLPKLTKDVSEQNMESIRRIRDLEVERKLLAQQLLWREYKKYVVLVEKSVNLIEKLMDALLASLDSAEMDKLAVKLMILDRLKSHITNGKLRRAR